MKWNEVKNPPREVETYTTISKCSTVAKAKDTHFWVDEVVKFDEK